MKKLIVAAALFAAAFAFINFYLPRAVESGAPVCETVFPETRAVCDEVSAKGELCFGEEHEITSALPVVIKRLYVRSGSEVAVGDEIALVDREATAAFIESLGKINTLSIAAADLGAAVSLIPEKIYSDCAGRVVEVCAKGSCVGSGGCVAAVAQSGEIGVEAAVSELDIAKIKLGQKASFSLAAYPDERFSGRVEEISPFARSRYSGAVLETVVDVRIAPDKTDERFRTGLSADVSIELSAPAEIMTLPYSAIGQDDAGEYVYVFSDKTAVRRGVTTGREFSDGTEIVSGISAFDEVFLSPEEIAKSAFVREAGDEKRGGE